MDVMFDVVLLIDGWEEERKEELEGRKSLLYCRGAGKITDSIANALSLNGAMFGGKAPRYEYDWKFISTALAHNRNPRERDARSTTCR